MKKFLLIFLLSIVSSISYSQTWSEWFKQASTQKKYLLENIANNQIYLQVLKNGYAVYRDGTNTWKGLKSGDLSMHQTYFTSLKNVNPNIANNPKVQTIALDQDQILNLYQQGKKEFSAAKFIHADEKAYINRVYQNLLIECGKSMDELKLIIINGQSQMSDDERMHHIDKLYDDMQDKKVFIISFNNDTRILNLQRQKESIQNSTIKSYFNN